MGTSLDPVLEELMRWRSIIVGTQECLRYEITHFS